MPRAAANPPHVILDTLKHLRFIDDKGTILPWNHDVWEIATVAMNGKMSKDYLYLYLSQNRHNVFNKIHGIETLGLTEDSSNVDNTGDDADDDSRQDPNWSIGETNCCLPALRKDVNISESEWAALKCHVVQYKEREYEVLVIGWTDALYDILWSHMKLPCPFAFKNAKINRNPGETFLTVKGSCSECGSKIHIYCQSEPTDSGTTLHISTFDSRGVVHQNKRQVSGERRMRIGKELQGKSTYAWRREEANRLMEFGDVIPANIPSEEVVRKAKQETRDKDLGLFKVKSALASVWDLKYGLEFSGCIHEICMDKFFVMYWTPTQLYMYKQFLKEDYAGSISIDATGSLVKQIRKPDGSKCVVYLYQAVCGYLGKILPLFQLISEKHDTNTLTYWIREWIRLGGSPPKQVVTDYSLALLNATSLAFNDMNLKTYIEKCLVLDSNGSSVRVNSPECIIRLDIAHFIKMVARWKCFNHESSQKKDFYLRCVGLLTTCTSINDFVQLCTDVITIALATHEDIEDKNSHCFAAQNRVTERLKSYKLPDNGGDELDGHQDEKESLLERFNDVDAETELDSSTAVEVIFKKIESNSKNDLKHGRLNPYQCSEFGSRLLKLVKQFVLWTAVMVGDHPNSSTLVELPSDNDVRLVSSSARSEEYFRELKDLVFKKGKAIRIDKVLVIHLRNLAGTTILLNADSKKIKKKRLKVPHSTPRVTDPVQKESATLVMESLTSTIESVFHQEDVLNQSVTEDPQREKRCEHHLEAKFDHGNAVEGEVRYKRQRACEDDGDDTIEDDSMQKQKKPNDTTLVGSLDDVSTEPEQVSMTFLNEIENWRGLTKKTEPIQPKTQGRLKKRGKYLTPCPDIRIIRERPKFRLALPLLVNGNSLSPVKIGKVIIAVRNTCAFDSTAQSMLAAFHDFATYHDHITKSKIALHDFVETLSTSGSCCKIYNKRFEILKHTSEIKNGVLDCEINIANLIESYILPNTPSLEIKVCCSDCQRTKTTIIPVLDLNPDPIFKDAMKGLQQAVSQSAEYYSSKTGSECCFCKGTNVAKTFAGGNHIFLNLEAAEIELLAARHGLANCRKQFTLSEIPENLNYCNRQYRLVSVVIFISGHYYACVKRASGTWEEHNDLCSSRRVMAMTNREMLKQRRTPLLFYVQI